MLRSHRASHWVALLVLAGFGGAAAQSEGTGGGARSSGAGKPVARAARVALPPKIDGVLSDPAWQSAEPIRGFVQRDPDEGLPATEATEVRVLYSDEALWIAIRASDSKAQDIVAILSRRDEPSPSDEITVMIDSYQDRRTGFAFTVNAAGVKRDAFLYEDTNRDDRWDAVWDAKTSVDSTGWSAEFKIPFSQIRFSGSATQTFGFNVSRRISRNNETQFWRLIPRQSSGFVSLFGDLTNLDGIKPPRRLEVLPYTAATNHSSPATAGNPFQPGVIRRANFGGDVKVGLGSALTLTATVNPDFGQVEADPATVNLSAFESFFAERRPFFTEGLDLFSFRLGDGDGDGSEEALFYTRRIGRAPQGRADPRGGFAERIDRTTILSAAKLSGKTRSGWSLGVLGALTDREEARVLSGGGQTFGDVVEPRTGYGVARVQKELRNGQTVVSLFGTTVTRSVPDNLPWLHSGAYTGGLSWSHRFAANTYHFSGRFSGSLVRGSREALLATQQSSARYFQRPDNDYADVDSTRTSLSGYDLGINGGRTAGALRWNVNLTARSPGYEVNDLGFMRQTDELGQSVWINRRWLQPGKVFRRFNVNANQWSSYTFGGDRRNLGGNINLNYTLLNYWGGYLGLNRNLGGLDPTVLRGGPGFIRPGTTNGWTGFETDGRKPFRAGVNGWAFAEDESGSRGFGLSVRFSWRPSPNVNLSAAPGVNVNRNNRQYLTRASVAQQSEYLLAGLKQTSASMTFRSDLTVSPTLSLQLYAEPFVSSGSYLSFKRVVAPRAARFADRVQVLGPDRAARDPNGDVLLDVDGNGTQDLVLNNPDFTYLSFRSNVVLRWEYSLGSTFFLVWQHGRSGFDSDGQFRVGDRLGDLFRSPADNVILVKLNYWLGL